MVVKQKKRGSRCHFCKKFIALVVHETMNTCQENICGTVDMDTLEWFQKLASENLVEEYCYCASKQIKFCKTCLKGKHQRSQFPPYSKRTTNEPPELVHSDIYRKLESKSLSGAEYFITFIDDNTRYVWVYVIKHKSDVFKIFCEWKTEVEKSLRHCVKTLRTDNGGEYTSTEFEEYLRNEGIKYELTIPKCPEQNGVAERLHRT